MPPKSSLNWIYFWVILFQQQVCNCLLFVMKISSFLYKHEIVSVLEKKKHHKKRKSALNPGQCLKIRVVIKRSMTILHYTMATLGFSPVLIAVSQLLPEESALCSCSHTSGFQAALRCHCLGVSVYRRSSLTVHQNRVLMTHIFPIPKKPGTEVCVSQTLRTHHLCI